MRRHKWFVSIVSVSLLLGLLAVNPKPAEADGELASWAPPLLDTTDRLSKAWCQADGNAVQALCTPPLWARLSSRFAGSPAPGSLGHMEVVQSGNRVTPTIAWVQVVCRHPDGVCDVCVITLEKIGDQWKVAGGPCGMTE